MRKHLTSLLLALAALTGSAGAACADTPTDVVVEDTAGTLDLNTLLPAVEKIDFYEPTKVAVYTRAGEYEDNFNEEVLAYARAEHPEWLSADGQKWADGLYLFALDPVGRQVGTYMGEDRKVSPAARTMIQESTYDFLRDAQWTDGTVQGIESGAKIINRPWYRSPALLWCTGIVFFGAGGVLLKRARNRRENLHDSRMALRRGREAYSSVTMNLEATELNANTIPEGSRYGAKVLERHRAFTAEYARLTRMSQEAGLRTEKDMKKRSVRRGIEAFANLAAELDGVDDLISDTNTLLNRSPGWERAWDRQTASVKKDLEGIDKALQGQGDEPTGQALSRFGREAAAAMDRLLAGLTEGSMSPEQALDGLRDVRSELSTLLANHSHTVIGAYYSNPQEGAMVRKAIDKSSRNAPRDRGSILDTTYADVTYYSVTSFNQGYSSGSNDVRSARAAARPSSSTGYGSSGGSFSGSGSSSRF